MRCVLFSGVICALNIAASTPADAAPNARDAKPQGAVVSTLMGPIGFMAGREKTPPTLHVHEISVRADLYPSLALVSQTWTLENPGDRTTTTVGISQRSHTLEDGRRLRTMRPLGATAWLEGRPLPEGSVRIHALPGDSSHDPGYEVAVSVTLPHGVSELSVVVAIPTVPEVADGDVKRPSPEAEAHFALQFSHFAWDWAPDHSSGPGGDRRLGSRPKTATVLATGGGVTLKSLLAESWTAGTLTDGSAYFWSAPPWFAVRYPRPAGVLRPESHDLLVRRARQLLSRAPVGHVTLPEGVEPATVPGSGGGHRVLDPERARRALIVPISALVLLFLFGYLYVRRRLT